MVNPNSIPGSPDPDRRIIDEQADDIGNRATRRVGVVPALIAGGATLIGAALAATNTPDIVKRWVFPVAGKKERPTTARDRLKSSRADAENIIDEILAREPKITKRTVNEAELTVRIGAILVDKNVSRDEVWDMIIAWQDTELLAIARRYKALDNVETASDPNVLEKRLPLMHQAVGQISPQLKKHVITEGKWTSWTEYLNKKEADPKVLQQACTDIRTFMVENRLHFSADAAVALAEGARWKINAQGRQRLVAFERQLLREFVANRHELVGEARTFRATLASVDKLAALHTRFGAQMSKNGLLPGGDVVQKKAIDQRVARIHAAGDALARVITVLELRNQSIDNPAQWKGDCDRALTQYFGEGKVPAEVAPALRLARLEATDSLRAELNNDHPDCAKAEIILQNLGRGLLPNADPAPAVKQARDFVEKTKDADDPAVRHARTLIEGLLGRGLTAEGVREAYANMGKHRAMPVGEAVVDRLVEWAGKHKTSFRDADFKNPAVLDRYEKSGQEWARSITVAMHEILRWHHEQFGWQVGRSAFTTDVDTQNLSDTAFVLDSRAVGLQQDQRKYAKENADEICALLGELSDFQKVKNIDIRRDRASKIVQLMRKLIHVIDIIRGMEGQTTPQTAALQEILKEYNDAPLRALLSAYETEIEFLKSSESDTGKAAADREASKNDPAIETHLEAFRKAPITVQSLQAMLERGDMPAAQRTALRIALEEQRSNALRPFLTEQLAHVLAIVGYDNERRRITGDMVRSRDSWWNTILFILGVIMTVKGGQGLLNVRRDRKNARKLARAVAKELLAQQQNSDLICATIEKSVGELEKRKALKGVPVVHDPQEELGGRFDALSKALMGKDDEETDLTTMTSGKTARCLQKAVKIDELLWSAQACVSLTNISPTISAQVQMRSLERTATAIHQKLGKAIDLIDTSAAMAPAIRPVLGQLCGKLGDICSHLRQLEKDLPPTDPTLATISNIDAASHGELALVAQSLGEPFHVALDELRANLKKHQQPNTPPVPLPPSNPPPAPPSVS